MRLFAKVISIDNNSFLYLLQKKIVFFIYAKKISLIEYIHVINHIKVRAKVELHGDVVLFISM